MSEDETETPRNNEWLTERIRLLWENHFSDVPKGFPIASSFGSRAQFRFGSIAARNGKCVILINQLFANPSVPTFVVDATLAHELAHYAHGFGSGLPKKYANAHKGGVVDKELEARGLGEVSAKAEQWRKIHWQSFHAGECGDIVERKSARQDDANALWDVVLERKDARTIGELQGRLTALLPRFGLTPDSLRFEVEWLRASRRQMGLSYWFAEEQTLRLHGLLADRRVPGVVVDFELAYWLARQTRGTSWQIVHAALRRAGLESAADEALQWRREKWTAFCNRNHPLGSK